MILPTYYLLILVLIHKYNLAIRLVIHKSVNVSAINKIESVLTYYIFNYLLSS